MRVLLLFTVALTVWCQTALPVQQVRGVTSTSGLVLLTLPDGKVREALLDGSFTIDTAGDRPILRVTVPSGARIARLKVVAGTAPPQAYEISGTGLTVTKTMVFRNGLLQSEGDDFSFAAAASSGRVTFNTGPATTIQPGDIIQIVAIL